MRNRGVLLLALVIAAVLAAGSVYAFVNAGDDSGPTIDALPSPSPTPSATESTTPSPTPSATESSTPSPTSSPTPAATRSATPSATKSSSPRATSGSQTYAYPRPSRQYEGLQMSITASNESDQSADPRDYTVTIRATDGDGTIFFNGLSWGDGTSQPAQANPQHCKSYPPLTSRPGSYQPQDANATRPKVYTFHHHYPSIDQAYRITARVASVNVDCRPHGPAREDKTLQVTVHPTAV